jgi:hypothetical protein
VTTPDSRPVLDVIAEALGTCDEWRDNYDEHQRRQAAAVLSACQGATVEQQAELTGGEVEWWSFFENGEPYSHIKPYRDFINGSVTPPAKIAQYLRRSGDTAKPRAVGPWREDPS